MNTKNYAKLTPAILIAWFTFALSASAMHLFLNESQRVASPSPSPPSRQSSSSPRGSRHRKLFANLLYL